jgi:valyl-tRNA synthetase
MEFEKKYDHTKLESRWAKWWVESNICNADPSVPLSRFSIVIPPPSVSGSLYMGHMLEHSSIDATVRWHRMRGDNTPWLPGTDHAENATQVLVERNLGSEGTSRTQLGREGFKNRIWQWTEKCSRRIIDQMKRIGDRWIGAGKIYAFSGMSQAVTEPFVRL